MYKSQYLNNDLISLCKVPAPIKIGFIRQLDNWFECNGLEWTINRIKAVKLACIRSYSGLNHSLSWFKISKNGRVSGYPGALIRYSLIDKNHLREVIKLLNCYTGFISKTVTKQQIDKFITGVNSLPVDIGTDYDILIRTAAFTAVGPRRCSEDFKPFIIRPSSINRREPHASGKTYIEGKYPLECLTSYVKQTKSGTTLVSKYRPFFKPVLDGITFTDHRDCDYASTVVWEYTDHVGRISFIQEPGFKLRAVANPARVYQEVLRPLGTSIYKIISTLPWDCTHEQSLPFIIVQQHLKSKKRVYSVDLTGATDYFPLSLQLSVLNTIFPYQEDMVNIFEDISKSPWMMPDGSIIRWKKGQPLGLFPSFGSFALCHGLLLFGLNNMRHDNCFFVLGDDVIILDDDLHQKYREALTTFGCPVSESKSIQSDTLAEFGGKILLEDSVIDNCKWHSPNEDNFIDLIKNFGPKYARFLQPNFRLAASKIWEIPECLGGLGFNPNGLTLEKRFELYYTNKSSNQGYKLSYDNWFNHLNYSGTPKEYSFRETLVSKKVSDDKPLISYFNTYLPNLINWWDVCGKNLFTIQPDLPIRIDSVGKTVSKYAYIMRNY